MSDNVVTSNSSNEKYSQIYSRKNKKQNTGVKINTHSGSTEIPVKKSKKKY